MNSWTPSSLSPRKLITSFSLVCFVLSLPLFYLLYASYSDFDNQYQNNYLEIMGENVVGELLREFSRLNYTDDLSYFEDKKKIMQNELIVKNILKLGPEQLNEVKAIFNADQRLSHQSLALNYYLPMIRFISNHSRLILDPDLDSYYFMDILVFRLPRIYSLLTDVHNGGFDNTKLLADLRPILDETRYSLRIAINEHLRNKHRSTHDFPHIINLQSVIDEVNSQLAGKKTFNTEAISLKLKFFEKDVVEELHHILIDKNNILTREKHLVLLFTLSIWFFGIVAGYFLFVKILKSHAEIMDKFSYQTKHLQESDKLSFVGEIASSIAHEVKNPLTVIDFEAASVRKNINSDHFDKDNAFNKLTKISEMSNRINKISNIITNFSRRSSNDPFENVPLKKILDETLYLTQLKASALSIPIEVSYLDFDLCCRVIQLEQVFINLINNAIDAVESLEERWIKIIPSLITKDDEEWVVVRIVDSGRGIKKEILDNMFNSFFTTKGAGKGTGLGLSVALRIIDEHHGSIHYEEYEGHTSFVVEVPRVQPLI